MLQGIPTRLITFSMLLLVLSGVIHAVMLFRQDLLYSRVETELGFWGRAGYLPTSATVQRTGRELTDLLGFAAADPQYLALQATYDAWQGYWEEDMQQEQQFYRQAVQVQHEALESRPAHRHSWVKMLQYSSRLYDGVPMRTAVQARLQMLQPATDLNE